MNPLYILRNEMSESEKIHEKSKDIISNSFGVEDIKEAHFFDGLVSRKKQIVPKIMNYMDNK